MPRPRLSFEDKIIMGIIIVIALFFLWWLSGCARATKSATVRYKASENCQWSISGVEAIQAEEIEQEFKVGEDCSLIRKTRAGKIEELPESQ